jgi:hypothetical protein
VVSDDATNGDSSRLRRHPTQIASVNAALQKVALGLVDQHLRHASWTQSTPNQGAASSPSPDATLTV